MSLPETTTVIMTRDRCDELRRSLGRHIGPVIVVDNGSHDDTAAMVREEFPEVELVELGANYEATARNIGVERARTPLVAFADDDSWWEPGALERAATYFRDSPRLALLAGRVLVGGEGRLDPASAEMATAPLGRAVDMPGPSVLGFLACGAVVRRSAFLSVGGFDDLIGLAGEEELLALDLAQAGWGQAYADDVVARHHPSPSRETGGAREARQHRNRLLTAVMRRRWGVVWSRATVAMRTGAGRRGLARACWPLLPALRRRYPVGPVVEFDCDVLERGQAAPTG